MFVAAEQTTHRPRTPGQRLRTRRSTSAAEHRLARRYDRKIDALPRQVRLEHHRQPSPRVDPDRRQPEDRPEYCRASTTPPAHRQRHRRLVASTTRTSRSSDAGNGGKAKILRYTGNLTDNLTFTGAVWRARPAKHINTYDGYDINQPLFQVIGAGRHARAPGLTYNNPQPLTGNILPPPGAEDEDEVDAPRPRVQDRYAHHPRRSGRQQDCLARTPVTSVPAAAPGPTASCQRRPRRPRRSRSAASASAVASGGGLGTQGYYVSESILQHASRMRTSDQSAQYIEDRWQVTKNVLLTAGLRNEQFANKNGDDDAFMDMKDQFAPRFSAVVGRQRRRIDEGVR